MKPFNKIQGKLSKTKLSVLFGTIALIAVFVCVQMVKADTGSNAYGYAWSSNTGWISLNDCSNPSDSSTCNPTASYGVSILPVAPGTITGYAWSANLGWITFNDPSCPTAGCTPGAYADWAHPNSDGSVNIKGWARACSVYASGCSGALNPSATLGKCDSSNPGTDPSCEWDGYIALDSTTAGGTGGTWGLTIGSDDTIGGYAWGSQVIGWIKSITAKVSLNGPAVQMVADPNSILRGATSTLKVTASNIDGPNACTITTPGGNALAGLTMAQGSGNAWTGNLVVAPTITTLYTVTCTKGTQSAKATATVTVTYITTPPGSTPSGGGTSSGGSNSTNYCAVIDPQFAWDSDGTSCTISEQGGNSVTVAGSSQAAGGLLGTDGLYYANISLPVVGTGSTYTFQCTGGTQTSSLSVNVAACQQGFTIQVNPNSQQLVADAKDKNSSAVFTVSATPLDGFTGTINLTMQTWPSNIPASRQAVFDPATITCTANGCSTSQLTISVATADLTQTATYGTTSDPMTLIGTSGALISPPVSISVGTVVKTKPIYQEF